MDMNEVSNHKIYATVDKIDRQSLLATLIVHETYALCKSNSFQVLRCMYVK